MTETTLASPRPIADKREALLAAAQRLIARSGLHNTPTSAVARDAGVAVGTLYLYFPSKEALINALYRELLAQQYHAASGDVEPNVEPKAEPTTDPRELLWRSWAALARWHLDHPEASSVMRQCRASAILTAETRDAEERARAAGHARFAEAITAGRIRDLPGTAFAALYTGPIVALAESDGEVTDAVLRSTFDGVCRSVLPADVASATQPRQAIQKS